MKKIVVSAVNFNEGGPLSVLKDCLKSLKSICSVQNIEATVFVHKMELVKEYEKDFNIIEYPLIKTSWFKRLYFEYIECKKISKSIEPDLWIALHDMTPNVTCNQVVYCHNPAPFYKITGNELFTDTTFFLFCLFYKFLYKINIKKNTYVIVQQEWLRKEFEKIYGVKAIVAYPIGETYNVVGKAHIVQQKNEKFVFFYPAFPRVAKNFQVLLEASKLLADVRNDFEVLLSINGEENKYSKSLFDRYKHVKAIKFGDRKTREQVFDLYNQIDCMVFPSKLETWGLPISEFKGFNKPILLADCKYAHETVGNHQSVKFFNPDNVNELVNYMGLLIDNNLAYDYNETIVPSSPFFHNWDGLVNFLLK